MLRITIELLPGGDETHKTTLGTATIALVGANESATRGTYIARFSGKGGRLMREVMVREFPRKRLLGWDLLYRALREAVGGRNE